MNRDKQQSDPAPPTVGAAEIDPEQIDAASLPETQHPLPESGEFHIVGVGASAGGLEALEKFFAGMPVDTGMAFVVVQHLSPDFKSHMDELLARQTPIPVHRVEDGMPVEPNHIYLIPPKKEMIISGGKLLLTDKDPEQSLTLPIDHFLRSLAHDVGRHAIGVILSGTGTDGSRGICDIYSAGGLVIVQTEDSAKFDGMPRSAMETGSVDLVLPPESMPAALKNYAGLGPDDPKPKMDEAVAEDTPGTSKILKLLRQHHQIDFSNYKPSTVTRRIDRRLNLGDDVDLEEYAARLESDPAELDALYRDLLIGVTKFFRDAEAFEALSRLAVQRIVQRAEPHEEIRAWVAGCASGEEAYSLAILFHEALEAAERNNSVKIFATDMHRESLQVASGGVYSSDALSELSKARRRRYFQRRNDGYHVVSELRQMIVFAPHNVLADPPFTKLDLVTCRNLLIYFQPIAQKKVLSLFHFALKTGGMLFLGPSETPGEIADEFEAVDRHWKIFRKRRDIRLPADLRLPLGKKFESRERVPRGPMRFPDPVQTEAALYERLLDRFMPPSFLVDEDFQLLHTFGGSESLLKVKGGRSSTNLLDLVDSDLRTSLSGALQHALKSNHRVEYSGIEVRRDDRVQKFRLLVEPVAGANEGQRNLIVRLETAGETHPAIDAEEVDVESLDVAEMSRARIEDLENELRFTKENLQATIEELETSNEELQATNEELVASNEELQSTNEELHSVNEELYTVNSEHHRKIGELTQMSDDMEHLLASTDVGVIYLDKHLRIRRFTPRVAEAFHLIEQDIGRRIDDFAHNIDDEQLLERIAEVLETEEPVEREVRDRHGNYYFLRILPYRTKGETEGVVLTLIDIAALKQSELRAARLSAIVESSEDAIIGKNLEGKITTWNSGAERLYGYSAEEAIGQHFSLIVPDDKLAELETMLDRLRHGERVTVFESVRQTKDGQRLEVSRQISPIRDAAGEVIGFSAIDRDISAQKRSERRLATEHAVVQILSEAETFDEAAPQIMEAFCEHLGVDLCELWLPTPNHRALRCVAFHSLYDADVVRNFEQLTHDARLSPGQGLAGQAWQSGETVWLVDLQENPQFFRREVAQGLELKSGLAFPVVLRGRCVAVLSFFWRHPMPPEGPLVDMTRAIGQDIAQFVERSRVERRLRESEERTRSIVDSALDAVVTISEQGEILRWNPQAQEIFGYTAAEARGKKLIDLVIPKWHREQFEAGLKKFHETGTADVLGDRLELVGRRRDGREFPLELTVAAHRHGNEWEFSGFVRDITERKQAEADIRQQVELREQFLAMLSHELRNPLGAIRNAVRLLTREKTDTQTDEEARGIIERQTAQMTRLLDDLLDVSRITQNKIELRRSVSDLVAVSQEAVEAARGHFLSYDVPLKVEMDQDPIPANIDPARLQQVEVNLLNNAAKYSSPGREVLLRVVRDGGEAVISVRDQGVGMTPEMLSRVFDLFVQADPTLDRSHGGMGVGLTLVKSLVELHGGTVTAHSDGLGQGSEFIVRLPLADESNLANEKDEYEFQIVRRRIVLIEDQADNRDMLQVLLEMDGHQVYSAADGEEGLALIERENPDFALVDIGLPKLNGYEVAQRVEQQRDRITTTLVALTGYGQTTDIERTRAAGFAHHVVKPVDPDLLSQLLSTEEEPRT